MKMYRAWLALSLASSLLFLFARPLTSGDWPVVPKTLSILLLASIGFPVNRLLGAALLLSAIGDFVLGVHSIGRIGADSLFMAGLISFLLAHVVYVVMFRRYLPTRWWRPLGWRAAGIAIILVTLGSMVWILYPTLGPMLIAVIVYSIVLCAMAISATLADLGNPWAAIGGLCFVASDGMLAINKFHAPFRGSDPLIWITYYAAQFLILHGVTNNSTQDH